MAGLDLHMHIHTQLTASEYQISILFLHLQTFTNYARLPERQFNMDSKYGSLHIMNVTLSLFTFRYTSSRGGGNSHKMSVILRFHHKTRHKKSSPDRSLLSTFLRSCFFLLFVFRKVVVFAHCWVILFFFGFFLGYGAVDYFSPFGLGRGLIG